MGTRHREWAVGIYCQGSSPPPIANCTISGNMAGGDVFDLACWHGAIRPSGQGGFVGVTLTVFHDDGTNKT